jgi:hypothetical protein
MSLMEQNYDDDLDDKDPWPEPPVRVSLDHTPEQ